MRKVMPSRRAVPALLLVALAAASGCGDGGPGLPTSQVAAIVNSDEITQRQINEVLARSPALTTEAAAKLKRDALDKLIDQQLARQQAISKGLDQSRHVEHAIEAARTEIFARAYLEQIAASQANPAPEEVSRYFAEHPELFAQRRVYDLEEITMASQQGAAAALRERVAAARSMREISDWLGRREIPHAAQRGVRAAEQVSLELLPTLQAMKDGDMQVVESAGNGLVVLRLIASQTVPIGEADAVPRIRQFLANRRAGEAIASELKRLKGSAQIEYLGEFAKAGGTGEVKFAGRGTAGTAQ